MNLRTAPRDGKSRSLNLSSQPHVIQRVFNNHEVLTKGWYPVCTSRELKAGECRSYTIFKQRIVVFRTQSGNLHALDAFCPHLGADLGNGRVIGEKIQCYFHQWSYSGEGHLVEIACRKKQSAAEAGETPLGQGLDQVKTRSYPVTEAYGHLWVFSASEANHKLPKPVTFEHYQHHELDALYIKEANLFAHHHIMMANGVDLQHFASVHNLDIAFDYQIKTDTPGIFDWTLRGEIPTDNLKGRLARWLVGNEFEYHVRFAGGSMTFITYGSDQRFMGFKLPSLQILWGGLPQESGVSKARIFLITPKRKGLLGKLQTQLIYFSAFALLAMLRDEDVNAFPHMRFNTHRLIKEDASLGRLIQLTNQLELSDWGTVP